MLHSIGTNRDAVNEGANAEATGNWQEYELTDVTAKVVYEAGPLRASRGAPALLQRIRFPSIGGCIESEIQVVASSTIDIKDNFLTVFLKNRAVQRAGGLSRP